MLQYHHKTIIILSLLCLCTAACNDFTLSEEQSERFIKYYPAGSSGTEGFDLAQTSGGGYLIIGSAYKTTGSTTHRDIMIIATDAYGKKESWCPLLTGTEGDDYARSMVMTGNDFVIAGATVQSGISSGYVIKVSLTGQLIWEKVLDPGGYDLDLLKIIESSNGGYVVTGYSKPAGGDKQVYLCKITSDAEELWSREIGFVNYDDVGESVIEYKSRYLIAGTTAPVTSVAGYSRILIFNTNLEGRGTTELRLGGDNILTGKNILADPAGNIILAGNYENPFSGKSGLFLVQASLSGTNNEIINLITSGNIEYAESLHSESVIMNDDNSIALCGWRKLQNDQDIMLAIIDKDFKLKKMQVFGDAGYQAAYGIAKTWDNGYILTGGAELAGSVITALIKLGPDGEL